MSSDTHLIAYMVIALWAQVILADTVGLIPAAEPFAWFLIVSFAASCLGLYFLRRGKLPMPWVIPWGGALVIAWCLFIGYVNLVEVVRLQNLVETPSRIGLSLMFLNGLVTAWIAGVVVGYPVAVVYRQWGGVVAPLLGLPVFALSGPAQ